MPRILDTLDSGSDAVMLGPSGIPLKDALATDPLVVAHRQRRGIDKGDTGTVAFARMQIDATRYQGAGQQLGQAGAYFIAAELSRRG
jgi:hypothetical protein